MITKRNNKRALYESIMKDVAKTVKKHLNESANEYYIWYANQEDGETHDMTYEEINGYRLGWQVAGPYDLNTAKREIINIAEGSLLDIFWEIEDEVYDYDEDEETELTDEEKIDCVKNRGNFYISTDGKYISFGDLHSDFNTMEWMILTKEEIKEREEAFNDEDDEEDDYYEEDQDD